MTLAKIFRYAKYVSVLAADALIFPFVLLGAIILGGFRLMMARYFGRSAYRLASKPIVLCLQPGAINAYNLHGDEILTYFKSPSSADIQILDPVSPVETEIVPVPGIRIIGWRPVVWYEWLNSVGMRETPILFRELATMARLLRHTSKNGVYCLRSMQHEHSALCGGMVSAALNIPHVVEVAGNYEMLRRIWGRPFYFQWFGSIAGMRSIVRLCNDFLLGWPLRRAYCVIGRNKNNYEHAFALGAPVERLTLIRIQLANSFSNEEAIPPPLSTRYMLFVARITTEKFPLDVVAVFEKLAERYPDLALVIIGDGVLLPEVRRKAEAMGCADRIHILGAKPYEEVIRWTRGATIAFETYSGSALAEKLICSVPVVAYDVEWMSEIIIDNFSGVLARFRDIDEAFEGCSTLLDNPARAKELACMGKQLALAMFDRATIMQKEERVFFDAIAYARLQHGVCD